MTGPAENSIVNDPATEEMRNMETTRLFEFDPFEPTPQEPVVDGGEKGEDAPPPEPPEDQEAGDKAGDGGREAQPPKTPTAPQANPELEELRRQMEALQEQNRTLTSVLQNQQKAPAAETPKAEEKPKVDPTDYNLGLPEEVLRMVGSEDFAERRTGMNWIVNNLAKTVTARAIEHFEGRMKEELSPVINGLPSMIERGVERTYTAQQVVNDFYGTYADLNIQQHGQLIQTVGQAVFAEKKTDKWSAEVRDEIARRVYPILGKPLPERLAPPKKAAGGKPVQLTPSGGTRSPARNLTGQDAYIADFIEGI